MKKRYIALIIVASVSVIGAGGVVVTKSVENELIKWGFMEDPNAPTVKEQTAYLKKHEDELVDYVEKTNPKITSVQFDWKSVDVGPIGNGTPWGDGNALTLDGKFNHIKDSEFYLQFNVDTKNGMPDIKHVSAMNSFRTLKDGVWYLYE